MKTDQFFKVAPYSVIAWIWTITYVLGLLFFGFRFVTALVNGFFPDPVDAVFTLALLILVVYAWLRSIRGYSIEDKQLVIVRAGPGRINIPLEEIKGVVADPAIGSFFNITFLSTGGVFGWASRVRVRNPLDLKSIDAVAYGTNPKYAVLVEQSNGRILVLTPADPQGLEGALRAEGAGSQVGVKKSQSATRSDGAKPWLQGSKK
ncbi:MAG: PH domain-containing protein [Chloroflexia bacterium]